MLSQNEQANVNFEFFKSKFVRQTVFVVVCRGFLVIFVTIDKFRHVPTVAEFRIGAVMTLQNGFFVF